MQFITSLCIPRPPVQKALSPLPYCNADDAYGLDGLFALEMPDPYNEFAKPVVLYYTTLHTIIQSNNVFYLFSRFCRSKCYPGRPNVVDHLKKKMLKFYKDFLEAWGELLTLKGFTTPAVASSRRSHAGIADQEPIAAAVPDFDE